MHDILAKFESGEIIGLVAVAGGLVVGLICGTLGILLGFYHESQETRRGEILAALKQDMLNRGMPADEIQSVLDAGLPGSRKGHSFRHSGRA